MRVQRSVTSPPTSANVLACSSRPARNNTSGDHPPHPSHATFGLCPRPQGQSSITFLWNPHLTSSPSTPSATPRCPQLAVASTAPPTCHLPLRRRGRRRGLVPPRPPALPPRAPLTSPLQPPSPRPSPLTCSPNAVPGPPPSKRAPDPSTVASATGTATASTLPSASQHLAPPVSVAPTSA